MTQAVWGMAVGCLALRAIAQDGDSASPQPGALPVRMQGQRAAQALLLCPWMAVVKPPLRPLPLLPQTLRLRAATRALATAQAVAAPPARHGKRSQHRCTLPALLEHRYTLTASVSTSVD